MGFTPGRQASDNVRKVVHLIHLLHHGKIHGFLLSFDTYKAFDTLSWEYLRFVLSRWGFGEAVLTWFKALYSTSTASVKYAGYFSSPFSIHRGMSQGCLLFPALLFLALEPLALALGADQNVRGIPYAGHDFKLSHFADDALLTLTNPLTTLPNLLSLLAHFSSISGY